ncbi:MAG TPA: methyltransferase [Trebonia sp.]|nr:methyltransferase [Trebonia sp.]
MTDDTSPPVPPETLQMHQLLSGFITSQVLYVAAELGIPDELLGGPRTVAELAAATGADADALRRLIRYLASFGVFRTDGDAVHLTDLGKTLTSGTPGSLRDFARYWMKTHYSPFSALLETARTGETAAAHYFGKPFFEWVGESGELSQLQNTAMVEGGAPARGALIDTYQLPAGHVVADIGGADGSLLTGLLRRHPDRAGIVFDLPAVVAGASKTIEAAGLSDRVRTVGGDFFGSVPEADVYLMSTVLHDWSDAEAGEILRTVAKSARPGARLVIVEMVLPEGDAPDFAKLVDVVMLGLLGGRERTRADWTRLLADAGFILDRVVPGPAAFSIIEATRSAS